MRFQPADDLHVDPPPEPLPEFCPRDRLAIGDGGQYGDVELAQLRQAGARRRRSAAARMTAP